MIINLARPLLLFPLLIVLVVSGCAQQTTQPIASDPLVENDSLVLQGVIANDDATALELSELNLIGSKFVIHQQWQQIPLLVSLYSREPNTYDQLLTTTAQFYEAGAADIQLIEGIMPALSNLLALRLPYASEQAVVEFYQAQLHILQTLQGQSADACYSYFNDDLRVGTTEYLDASPGLVAQNLNAMNQIILTADLTRPLPSEDTAMVLLAPVMQVLTEQHGDDVELMDAVGRPGVDSKKMCDLYVDLFNEILLMPTADAGTLLRWLAIAE